MDLRENRMIKSLCAFLNFISSTIFLESLDETAHALHEKSCSTIIILISNTRLDFSKYYIHLHLNLNDLKTMK